MDRVNDISFLLDGKLIVLVEHQATVNKNMPLRFLLYIGRLYEKLIQNKEIYRERQIKILRPEFIVLYNGKDEQPEEQILKLSDAYLETGKELELEVKIININYEKSTHLLEKSKTLNEYSYFVYLVKQYQKNGSLIDEAIYQAMRDCIEKGILKEFLEKHGSEVMNMLTAEFKLEEGERKGKKEGIILVAISLLDVLEDRVIAEKTGAWVWGVLMWWNHDF